jgi:hypothetical protein
MMTGREHEAMRDVSRRMLDRFTGLAARRDEPRMQERTADGKSLRWQRYELLGMLEAVNSERGALGQPPVTIQAIESADGQARGHADYARKLAWYCAEIVYGAFPLINEHG